MFWFKTLTDKNFFPRWCFSSIFGALIWMLFWFRWAVLTYYAKKLTFDAEVTTWLSRICCPIITSTRNSPPPRLSSQLVNLSLNLKLAFFPCPHGFYSFVNCDKPDVVYCKSICLPFHNSPLQPAWILVFPANNYSTVICGLPLVDDSRLGFILQFLIFRFPFLHILTVTVSFSSTLI